MRSVLDPQSTFEVAAAEWLAGHRDRIKPRTAYDYEQYIATLKLFGIAKMPIASIDIGTFAAYQVWRKTNPKRGAGNPRINQELNCLSQILDQAGLWKDIEHYYQPLRMPKWKPPRVLTPEQEAAVLEVAASNKNWLVASCALVLMNNTAIGPGETRVIQLVHVKLDDKKIYVAAGDEGDKNPYRIAPVALNEEALWAVAMLKERYQEICRKQGIAESEDHFLFPLRVKRGTFDPRRPASPSFIRSAMREIRAASGVPRLHPYMFRHQCLTAMLEIPEISEETVQAVARHKIGSKTLQHYSNIRMHKKQEAVDLLLARRRVAAMRRPPQRDTDERTDIQTRNRA